MCFIGIIFPATQSNTPSHGFCSVGGSTRARDNIIIYCIINVVTYVFVRCMFAFSLKHASSMRGSDIDMVENRFLMLAVAAGSAGLRDL